MQQIHGARIVINAVLALSDTENATLSQERATATPIAFADSGQERCVALAPKDIKERNATSLFFQIFLSFLLSRASFQETSTKNLP
jgi:hypothetical protein